MPDLARFPTVDPWADDYERQTPYAYAANNPIRYTDFDGKGPFDNVLDVLQVGLDVAGMIPGAGNAFDLVNAGISVARGDNVGAALSLAAAIPGVGLAVGAGKLIGKATKGIAKVFKGSKKAKGVIEVGTPFVDDVVDTGGLIKKGRSGKQAKLNELANDGKVSSADRGWIKQEKNQIKRGKRRNIRNPPGKDLAHDRGREAAKGYSYKHSKLKDRKSHRSQHKYDNNGKKNKERPLD